ncbi:MAG: cytochrome c-type biogenesis protein [Reyranellaceae bacterium]
MKTLRLLLLLAIVLLPGTAAAVQPDEMLADPALEARARDISRDLRCLVCQNQSIDDSDAPLARDLRLLVRERLVAGDSDAQVYDFVVARYGDFVLLRPPVKPVTWLLWFGPALMLVLGGIAVVVWFRRRPTATTAAAPLGAEDRACLQRLLDEDGA